MTIAILPNLRVLPVVEPEPTNIDPHWRLFGAFPGTRDVYRSIHAYFYAFDPNTPPTVTETILAEAGSRLDGCTALALIYGNDWSDMVDQFREARGRPPRAKRAARNLVWRLDKD